MKILITGGAGFIGSHLSELLLVRGHRVVVLDNFCDFYDPAIKRQNIEFACAHPEYTLIEGDILDTTTLDPIMDDSLDAVVHLAALAGVRPSLRNPVAYQRTNVEGTVNLLEQCRRNGIPRFIFASSSSVYGGRTHVPFSETDDISRPVSPYAATKAAGEALCHTWHHLYGIHVHALRFFTVYGPRQRPEMAIHLFARKMLCGEPIHLYGDGHSSRDYTYISDIVDGIVASVETCHGFDLINLGGSRTTSLNHLIQLIADALKVTPIIEHHPDQPGDVPITCANIARAAHLLNYAPEVPIETGVPLFCQWLRQQLSAVDGCNPTARGISTAQRTRKVSE